MEGDVQIPTRGIICWWIFPVTGQQCIDFVTISTLGNAADFGDLTTSRIERALGGSNATRGIFAGGMDIWKTNAT